MVFNVPFGISTVGKYATHIGGNLPYYAIYTALVALTAPIILVLSSTSLVSQSISPESAYLISMMPATATYTLFLFILVIASIGEPSTEK